jgi:hypothetical protein
VIEPPRPFRWSALAATVLVLALLGLWVVHLDTPWSRVKGFADWISCSNGRIAINYQRYGLETRGAQVMNLAPAADAADRVLYHGHPPTLDLLVAGVTSLVGSQEAWAQRLLPLAASIAALWLFFLAARGGRDPWLCTALFATAPILGAHGVNLSYEPLCLAAMLGVVVLHARGHRKTALFVLAAGGLVDYPVLYLAAPLLADAWQQRRVRSSFAPYAAALVLTTLLSFATAVALQVVPTALATGYAGIDWSAKVQQAMAAAPGLGDFLLGQARALMDAFTLPGMALAVVAMVVTRRLGWVAGSFLFAGVFHVLAFRSHAALHDFWWFYLLPFVALGGGELLARLPHWLAALTLGLVAALGLHDSLGVWSERRAPPVRAVAADLRKLFPNEVVLHQVLAPPGWALETFRQAPVLEGQDLLQALEVGERARVQIYLDLVGGTWGYLGRPQLLAAPRRRVPAGGREHLERVLPDAFVDERPGQHDSYLVYDLEPFLLDPARSPYITAKLGQAEAERLRDRMRMFLALPLLPGGARLVWLDGRASHRPERFRGREVRSGGQAELAAWQPSSGEWLVAWPGSAIEAALVERAGARLERRTLVVRGEPQAIACLAPLSEQ